MTRKNIARIIAEELGVTTVLMQQVVQIVLEAIIKGLEEDGRTELRNFGVFQVKRRKAKLGRNPKTGETVNVPEWWGVKFKPGTEMAEKVRKAPVKAIIDGRSRSPQSS